MVETGLPSIQALVKWNQHAGNKQAMPSSVLSREERGSKLHWISHDVAVSAYNVDLHR